MPKAKRPTDWFAVARAADPAPKVIPPAPDLLPSTPPAPGLTPANGTPVDDKASNTWDEVVRMTSGAQPLF